MAFFDDMNAALETYPETNVTIEIVDVVLTGSALNVNETASFRVKVTNTGPLNLTGVTLRVKGQNGATVKDSGAIAPFVSEFVGAELATIAAHGGSQLSPGSPYTLKAPGAAQAAKTLVKASLEAWDANLDHILLAHSDPLATVKGTYSSAVVAA
ncbi:hypothetical protein [Variovorax sp. YR752]|uniref:hypothetical protein n=1 Tax=Variovorax sp. YR752 TaxID=1884383 RepID=UPI0031380E19